MSRFWCRTVSFNGQRAAAWPRRTPTGTSATPSPSPDQRRRRSSNRPVPERLTVERCGTYCLGMRRILVVVVLCVGAASTSARSASAQEAVASSHTRSAMPTRADSLSALHAMDEVLRTNHTDGATWHERGVLAWRLANAEKRTGYMKRVANDSLLNLADSSLRLATKYNSTSPEYLVDLGKFYLTSNSASVRSCAIRAPSATSSTTRPSAPRPRTGPDRWSTSRPGTTSPRRSPSIRQTRM